MDRCDTVYDRTPDKDYTLGNDIKRQDTVLGTSIVSSQTGV